MLPLSLDLQVVKGSTKVFNLIALDDDGNPVDLTGANVIFSARRAIADESEVVHKTTFNTQITFPTQTGNALGTFEVKFSRLFDDTTHVNPGTYFYDIWVELATFPTGGNRTQLYYGKLTILPTITTQFI